MLQRFYRLTEEKDFTLLVKSRKSAFSRLLGLKARENHLDHSRFGVVVGLKVSKRANKRNLIKRRVREILRLHLNEIAPGHDVMVIGLAAAVGASYQELERDILAALKKLGLMKK